MKLKVRNYCLRQLSYKENSPEWAKPKEITGTNSGYTEIEIPDVKCKWFYEELNPFQFLNVPTYQGYKGRNYSGDSFYRFYDENGKNNGVAVIDTKTCCVEGIKFWKN